MAESHDEHEPLRMPTPEEILVLADFFEEQGDPRATAAREIDDPTNVDQLLTLLTESEQHEACCVFAKRMLDEELRDGREVDPLLSESLETKLAWVRGKATTMQLRTAREALKSGTARDLWRVVVQALDLEDPHELAPWIARMGRRRVGRKIRREFKDALNSGEDAWEARRDEVSQGWAAEELWQADWIMQKAWQSARRANG